MDEPNNILACPFCGSDGEIVKHSTGWRAHCTDPMCAVSINEMSSSGAARRIWNRRAGAHGHGATDGQRLAGARGSVSAVELGEALNQAVALIDVPEFKRSEEWHMGRDVVLHVWDKWCNRKQTQNRQALRRWGGRLVSTGREQPAGVCGRCGGSGIVQRHPFIERCGCGAAAVTLPESADDERDSVRSSALGRLCARWRADAEQSRGIAKKSTVAHMRTLHITRAMMLERCAADLEGAGTEPTEKLTDFEPEKAARAQKK